MTSFSRTNHLSKWLSPLQETASLPSLSHPAGWLTSPRRATSSSKERAEHGAQPPVPIGPRDRAMCLPLPGTRSGIDLHLPMHRPNSWSVHRFAPRTYYAGLAEHWCDRCRSLLRIRAEWADVMSRLPQTRFDQVVVYASFVHCSVVHYFYIISVFPIFPINLSPNRSRIGGPWFNFVRYSRILTSILTSIFLPDLYSFNLGDFRS